MQIFLLLLTTGVYALSSYLYKRTKIALLHPLILSIIAIVIVLQVLGIDYETYHQSTEIIHFMLGPCIVALGYTMHKQMDYIRGNALTILTALFIGSLVGIVSITLIGTLLGTDPALITTLEPKSVTAPIALRLSEKFGGTPNLTIVFVVSIGIVGSIVIPAFLRLIGIRKSMSIGLATGATAHGIGTARSIQIGTVEGAAAALALGIMGLFTSLLMPLVHSILH